MINSIPFLETSKSNFPETAGLIPMLQSTDCLNQELTLEEKVEGLASPTLLNRTPLSEDQACMNLSIEKILDDNCLETPSFSFLSEIDLPPFSPYPTTSNPDQSRSMLVETGSQPQPTSDEECDLVNPLLSKEVEINEAPCPFTSYLYPTENSPDQNSLFSSETLAGKETKPQLRRISDEAWAFVEPLFDKEVKSKIAANPRSALNSILLMAIKGVPFRSLPTSPNFSKKDATRQYFCFWRDNGSFEESLCLLANQAPSKSYYQNLLENFQKASNAQAKPISIKMLKMRKAAKSEFRGVTDKEWFLVEPLLSRKNEPKINPRATLNSIFLMLIDGVSADKISTDKDFASRNPTYKYFRLWRECGTLEKVLDQLVKVTQGSLQSDYRELLENLQSMPYSQTKHLSISSFKLKRETPLPDQSDSLSGSMLVETESQPQPTSDEECDLVTPLLSKEIESGASCSSASYLYPTENSPNQNSLFSSETLTDKETEPQLRRISDEKWALIKPLFDEEVESKKGRNPRSALNSVLFMAINGVPYNLLPTSPNFSTRQSTYRSFCFWRDNGSFEESLRLLAKAQGPSQSDYQNLLENFQRASNRKTKAISIEMLRMDKPATSAFQEGVTDKEWLLVKPLLSKKRKSRTNFRSALNSIFLMLIDGVPDYKIPVGPDFACRTSTCKCFQILRERATFEKVLGQLLEVTQGSLQSDYRDLLKHLKAKPYSQTGHLSISSFKLNRDTSLF